MTMDLATFMRTALELIERHAPACDRALRTALGHTVVLIRIDEELVYLIPETNGIHVASSSQGFEVDVACARVALRDLVEGGMSLVEAVLAERIYVSAAPEKLVEFHDAWTAFVGGAARSPRFLELLDELLGGVPSAPSSSPVLVA